MALPRWPLFAYAKHPVALSIKNCARLEELRASINAKVLNFQGLRLFGADSSVGAVEGRCFEIEWPRDVDCRCV